MKNKLIRDFKNAFRGIGISVMHERNLKLQLAVAALVVILMFLLNLKTADKVALFLVISLVLVLELINTAIERIVDLLKPDIHPLARDAKDILAGAVLVAAAAAAVAGLVIFIPYLKNI